AGADRGVECRRIAIVAQPDVQAVLGDQDTDGGDRENRRDHAGVQSSTVHLFSSPRGLTRVLPADRRVATARMGTGTAGILSQPRGSAASVLSTPCQFHNPATPNAQAIPNRRHPRHMEIEVEVASIELKVLIVWALGVLGLGSWALGVGRSLEVGSCEVVALTPTAKPPLRYHAPYMEWAKT